MWGTLGIAIILIFVLWIGVRRSNEADVSSSSNPGYEHIGGSLYMKDDELFYNRTTPAKLLGLSEIRNDRARLVQLEIRYAVDGSVKSERLYGSEDQLLTIAYKLGYQV